MKPVRNVLIASLMIIMACGSVWAQATAQMSGSVADASGAVLPGVEVTAMQTSTGLSRSTVTNETGYYVLPNLPLGPYTLEVSLPGFRKFVRTGIVLQVGSNPTINVVLEVGQVTETVEVQADAALVETRTVSVGQVMETARIMELPLNGRNAQELLLLGGGSVQTSTGSGQSFPGRLLISSAGARGTAGELTLDGIGHVAAFDNYPLPLPFPDALAEFKTEIGGMSAQQARGSQVSAVTRSGTNEFHGNLFEFVRNDLFNARPYYAIKGSTLKRNQFGGTIGGPVLKNKLFFFGGYQGTTLRQDSADRREFVPTAAMLAGDFTAFAAPPCTRVPVTLRAPFVNNRVSPALFHPIALKITARIPKSDNPCGELTYGRREITDEHQLVSKIDYQASDRHSVFGRMILNYHDQPSALKFTPDIPMNATNESKSRAYAIAIGSTYLVSNTTVNAFRLAFLRSYMLTNSPSYFDFTELGSNVYSGYAPGQANLNITGGFELPGSGRRYFPGDVFQLSNDVSMVRGTHQFGFGGRASHSRNNMRLGTGTPPNFNFAGTITGLGLADFLLGRPSDYIQGAGQMFYTRTNQISLYGQDTWQWKPRVSISYGLRWAPILAHQDVQRPVPFVLNFDEDRYRQGLRSAVFTKAPPGLLFPGDPEFKLDTNMPGADKPRANLWNSYWKGFAPRVGLAWDVEGNGRTSVRASYGLSYDDYPAIDRLGSQSSMPPYGSMTRILVPEGGFDDPWRGVAGGNPFPYQVSRDMNFVSRGEYVFRKNDITPTFTHTWNLSVQREVVSSTLVSASYIGSQITHLQAGMPVNLATYVPGVGDSSGRCFLNGQVTHFTVAPGAACSTVANTQTRRRLSFLNPQFQNEFGAVAYVDNGGTQHYHGMLLSIQRRPSRGINVGANYTLSHCIGDYQARTNNGYGISVTHTYQDPNNRRRDRGNCEIDQRHIFNLTALAETPQFGNRTLSLLGSGWRLSGIYRRTTGGASIQNSQAVGVRTVTIGAPAGSQTSIAGGDQCLCDVSNQRPDQISQNVYLDKSGRPGTQYLNPRAFALPAAGTLGNMGRVTLVLPPQWQFDMSLARIFRVREKHSVEFRAEAYNVTNSFRVDTINTNLSSAQFGLIRTAREPRIMQFALKYSF
jgi:hypothetical protein